MSSKPVTDERTYCPLRQFLECSPSCGWYDKYYSICGIQTISKYLFKIEMDMRQHD
jgi:hypothetical protein